jgi:hypothetical protein
MKRAVKRTSSGNEIYIHKIRISLKRAQVELIYAVTTKIFKAGKVLLLLVKELI